MSNSKYTDKVLPSANPPGGLKPEQVPQFMAFTSDDNGKSGHPGSNTIGGMSYFLDLLASRRNPAGKGNSATFDGSQTRASFYIAGFYAVRGQWEDPVYSKKLWRRAVIEGHEMGNHSFDHPHGYDNKFSPADWEKEILHCNEILTRPWRDDEQPGALDESVGPQVDPAAITGFRAPFLGYNDNLFPALKNLGFEYDTSLMEGLQADQDGSNTLWPYTLDAGSPGDAAWAARNNRQPIGKYPGLWELPNYVILTPPDEKCEQYGLAKGFRERLKQRYPSLDLASGKISGLDWEMWSGCSMTREEFVACFCYTFDQKYFGNRSPFIFCLHSDIYSEDYDDPMTGATAQDRRDALTDCYNYVLNRQDTRVVAMDQLLTWLRKPAAL